jgi:hypothetical protein
MGRILIVVLWAALSLPAQSAGYHSRNMGLDPITHRIYVAAASFAAPAAPRGGAPQGRGGRPTWFPARLSY